MSGRLHGIYHFSKNEGNDRSHLHLRVDPDGSAILLINANRLYHLNPSAAVMAYSILSSHSEHQAIKEIRRHFNVSKQTAQTDLETFRSTFQEMVTPNGRCPIHELDIEITHPFSTIPSAPYRMDLALTYSCNNDCAHCYNVKSRRLTEMSSRDWMRVIDRLWDVGIPHVVFTGGEPTLRPDLVELVKYASAKGQITGINTNGRKLKNKILVQELVSAGLDHVQITLESHDPSIHDGMVSHGGAWRETVEGIRNVVDSPLFLMTNTTLLSENSAQFIKLLGFLADLRVPTVGLNSLIRSGRGVKVNSGLNEDTLSLMLETAKTITAKNDQRLIWYTPTQYCHLDPVMLGLGVKGCSAARYNMCVEPDGSVIPCQSYYTSLGNILADKWAAIWNHDLARTLREHKDVPAECQSCSFLSECGGGCPLSRDLQHPIQLKIPISEQVETWRLP
jgi:radical SAM protein with 4Fe4S-binding SPASM domain